MDNDYYDFLDHSFDYKPKKRGHRGTMIKYLSIDWSRNHTQREIEIGQEQRICQK
jgi:hypothetical protein